MGADGFLANWVSLKQVKADRSETNTSTKDNIKKLQEETAKVSKQ